MQKLVGLRGRFADDALLLSSVAPKAARATKPSGVVAA
jgi:hypothetical protein